MTRSKIILERIENESARKATYRKRKEGLRKKLDELCILCDIKGCMIMYSPDFEGPPYVWPSIEEALELVVRFDGIPKIEQSKKMVSHEEYMNSRVEKLKEEVNKLEIKNKKMEASILIHKISNGKGMLEIEDLREARLLCWFAEEKLQEIQRHKLLFPMASSAVSPVTPPPAQLPAVTVSESGMQTLSLEPSSGGYEDQNGIPYNVVPESPMDPFFMAMLNYSGNTINNGASTSGQGN